MPVAAGAVGAGGGVLSAIIGSAEAGRQEQDATAARQAAVQQFLTLNVPDPKQQQIELQNYQVTGKLSPQLEATFQQSQSGLNGMTVDPTSRAAEVGALSKMEDLASSGGLDAQSRQQIQQATNQTNANEQGQRGAIIQNAAARGMGQGGGAMLAAELQASQGDANQAAASGMSAATGAQMRALSALQGSAGLGATLNSQDYAQKANAAAAQDAINRFNTQNQQAVAGTNVQAQNQAAASNLANAQSVANANTGVANEQEIHNKGLFQQQFDDATKKATGVANAEAGVATQANDNAKNIGNQWSGIGQAISQGGGAIGQAYNNKNKTPSAGSTAPSSEVA